MKIKYQIKEVPGFNRYYADVDGSIWYNSVHDRKDRSLNENQIRVVKRLLQLRLIQQKDIAKVFNVCKATITNVKQGKQYKPNKISKLKPFLDTRGYYTVKLYVAGIGKTLQIHQLIMKTFKGEPLFNMEVCHNDGFKLNNKLENLRYDTHKSNMFDTLIHGTNKNMKLNKQQVRVIRAFKQLKNRPTYKEIADFFEVSVITIRRVIKRRTYMHIKD